MTKQPFMPLFFADILANTPYWRGDERALFVLLLGYQWINGPLPGDVDDLAQSVQYDQKAFAKLWKRVGQRFTQTPEGWTNLLLEERRAKAKELSATRSALGSKGGAASASKRKAIAAAKGQAIAAPKAAANVIPIGSAIAQPIASANGVANLQANTQAKFNHLKKEEKNKEEESEASQGEEGGSSY